MKPDKIIFDVPDKLEVVQQIPVESKKIIDSITPFKGHTLFEINCSTGEVKEAKYEEVNASFVNGAVKRKVIINDNCLYISCLNKKSALKKYSKWIFERTMQNIQEQKTK